MFQPLKRPLALSVTALATLAVTAVPAAAAGAPKVKAKPHEVMVNTSTTLTGRHFPANSTITISECGSTSWLAPSDPCLRERDVTVTTDAKGRFETTFDAGVCEGKMTKRPTERICWVGELVTGEDNGELVGAAKLRVTYP